MLRYTRLILAISELWGYRRLAPVRHPDVARSQNSRSDGTIVAMTLGTEPHFRQVIQGWLRTEPKSIIITTLEARRTYIEGLVEEIGDSRIIVMAVETASYRRQCYEAISKVTTAFFVVVDDRSLWGVSTLDNILAPFRDPRVGGVTGLQAVKPRNGNTLTQWETFGALNLARRNVLHSALAFFNKGQVLNLSGRLSAYWTCIYKDRGFRDAFLHELWLGRFPITTRDDNALTTWLLHKCWRIAFQNSPGVIIAAGISPNWLYTRQLLRWLRDTLRYYLLDITFAFKTREKYHLLRAVLNIVVYFMTDFAMIFELAFLLSVSTASWLGQGEITGKR